VDKGIELLKLYEEKYSSLLVWRIAENFRFTKCFLQAAEAVKRGDIGKVLISQFEFKGTIDQDNRYYNTQWRKVPEYDGGFILDGGVHFLAAIRLILGNIHQISAVTQQLQEHLPPVDTFSASVKFENGSVGSIMVSFGLKNASPLSFVIYGEKGSIKVSRNELEVNVFGEKSEPIKVVDLDFEIEPIEKEIHSFLQMVVGKSKEDLNSPREALQDVAIIEAILQSGRTGQRLQPQIFVK